MATRKVSSKLILVFIDVGVVLGMILGYRNYNVDRLSLFTIGFLSLLVLNGLRWSIGCRWCPCPG